MGSIAAVAADSSPACADEGSAAREGLAAEGPEFHSGYSPGADR